ncbi:MAG TPA: DUF6658 family protein [Xenococcaceae cyanobacterium]
MKKLFQIIKSLRLKQILAVFLAGSLLVISTACSKGNVAQAGGRAYTETGKRAMSDTYDDYDANQSFKGGINGYNDDPRYNAETAAKTKALVDQAKARQKDNLGDYADNITDRAGDKINQAKKDVPRTLQANTERAAKDIQKRTETLKENVGNAPGEAKKVFDEAVDTAQNAVDDAL